MSVNDDDDARRRRGVASAHDVAVELLTRLGLPVPDNIDEVLANGPVEPPPPPEPAPIDTRVQYRARADAMLARDWPQRAVEIALAADETKMSIQAISAFEGRGALVLSGDVGRGKTVAAAWWSIRQPVAVTFVRAATLARTSRYSGTWEQWMKARALCIDDLGAEFADVKGSFAVDLDELIDTFYASQRTLIVTTNCKAGIFKQRYGARVLDRLSESGKWVNVTGESMRGRK